MARSLDRLLVVDVESTCWEDTPPAGEESEIIQVGVCLIDLNALERVERRNLFIRPERSTVSAFCTQLTTLTQTEVENGMSFADACAVLRGTLGGRERVWASYGDYDRRQFERQCQERSIAYPFGPTHLNVKSLFALAYGLRHEVGMDAALQHAGLPLEGTHHRGDDDAWNIAALLISLLKRMRA